MILKMGDSRDIEAVYSAIRFLAQRIGLLADRAADRLPEHTGAVFGGAAEDWMMPPLYHYQTEKRDIQPNTPE